MSSPVIINPGGAIRPAPLVEPVASGYVLLTAVVEPQNRPGPALPSRSRNEALAELAGGAEALGDEHLGCTVQLFRAVAFPPFEATPVAERHRDHIGRYDVVALVTAPSPEDLPAVEAGAAYGKLVAGLRERSEKLIVTRARNARRIADVPAEDKLHLFNFFLTDEEPAGLDLWEYLAGWYHQEMNMRDSEVLQPINPDETPFAFVNHASWNVGLARFVSRQMSRSSFRDFVIANLAANRIGSLPFLYRPYRVPGGKSL